MPASAITEDACLDALRATPGDAQRWAVFADLLQGRGDVRGQLIALSLSGRARTERQLRDKHRAHLGSPAFWNLLDTGALAPEWGFGHLRCAVLKFSPQPDADGAEPDANRFDPADLEAVLASPLACALEVLKLFLPPDAQAASRALDVLRDRRPSVHRLELTADLTSDALQVEGLLEALPRVTFAKLYGITSLVGLSSSRLESLVAWVSDWDGAPSCQLGRLDAPLLRALELRVRSETQPALTRWLREDVNAPSLRRLDVEAFVTSQLIDAIADAPFAATLERLRVLTIDEASAQALLTRRESFPRLRRVDTRFFRTSQAVEARVRAAFQG
ncbi:MAG: hypothetical protein Q8L14_25220 [Myxococcales bacterium]|nr:hypothetical protein [Myxococcales bacterium]